MRAPLQLTGSKGGLNPIYCAVCLPTVLYRWPLVQAVLTSSSHVRSWEWSDCDLRTSSSCHCDGNRNRVSLHFYVHCVCVCVCMGEERKKSERLLSVVTCIGFLDKIQIPALGHTCWHLLTTMCGVPCGAPIIAWAAEYARGFYWMAGGFLLCVCVCLYIYVTVSFFVNVFRAL